MTILILVLRKLWEKSQNCKKKLQWPFLFYFTLQTYIDKDYIL